MGLTRRFTLNAYDVLSCVLALDGAGSGLDADTLDGKHAQEIINDAKTDISNKTSYTPVENKIPMFNNNKNLKSSTPVDNNDVVTKQYFDTNMPSVSGYATETYVKTAISNAIGAAIGGSY